VHPVFYAKMLRKDPRNPLFKQTNPEPPLLEVEDSEIEYEVQEVLAVKLIRGKLKCEALVVVKDDSHCIYGELLLVILLMLSRTCYATCFALPSIAITIAALENIACPCAIIKLIRNKENVYKKCEESFIKTRKTCIKLLRNCL
jgi:hypothetical protein